MMEYNFTDDIDDINSPEYKHPLDRLIMDSNQLPNTIVETKNLNYSSNLPYITPVDDNDNTENINDNNKNIPQKSNIPDINIIGNNIDINNQSNDNNNSPIDKPEISDVIIKNINDSNEIQNNSTTMKCIIDPNKSLMGKEVTKAMPVYNLIKEGNGINETEEQGIVFCAMAIYQEEMKPLSNNTAQYIKEKLGGDWLVIVYPIEKSIDFNLTFLSRNDFMFFTLDTTAYQVCRLR